MSSASDAVYFSRKMIRSDVFNSLGKNAYKTFFRFMLKRRIARKPDKRGHRPINNNGEIEFPYSEGGKMGIARNRFNEALGELVEKGFIDIEHYGGSSKLDFNLYAISDRWMKYGKSEFIEKKMSKGRKTNNGFTSENWESRTGQKRKSEKQNPDNKTQPQQVYKT